MRLYVPSIIFQGRRFSRNDLSVFGFLILALPEGYQAEYACFIVVGQVNCGSTEDVPVKVQLYDE